MHTNFTVNRVHTSRIEIINNDHFKLVKKNQFSKHSEMSRFSSETKFPAVIYTSEGNDDDILVRRTKGLVDY